MTVPPPEGTTASPVELFSNAILVRSGDQVRLDPLPAYTI